MDRRVIQERVEHIRSLLDPERAKREKRVERSRGIAKGIAVGTLLGGLAGIFFAPDKGKNTRKKTKEELEKAKEILETNIQEGKGKFSEFMEERKSLLNGKTILVKDHSAHTADQVEEDDDYIYDDEEDLAKEEA
ncbi:YtxH domain-containing protein [Alkaliphilus transvaalensis]|uniref:YtxH domain-containing protein n=1 Tax=Alkaliphilus transvaalensis TaxID=114628 RepID=UPI000555C08A|nr:YtxH domain-containing protein [Alkaliphilus transvaalensis]